MKLSIIIPAYNEENRISPTLSDYYDFFSEKLRNGFEIIIVPNNCSDKTLKISEDFSRDKKQIKVLNIPYYCGKGGAVMEGFKRASGDYVGFTDADGSTNARNFLKLYENIGDSDGVIGSRRLPNSIVFERNLLESFSSWIFNRQVNLLFNLGYKDTQCGAKIFTKQIAEYLAKDYSQKGWIFDVDLLHLCKKNNFKIREFPVEWEGKKGSKLTFRGKVASLFKLFSYKILGLKDEKTH